MKSKVIKVLIFMIMIILLFGSLNVFALNPDDYKPTNPTIEENFIFMYKVGKILGVINAIGVICSVVVIAVIGIKYMLGSVEEKAEYKKTMLSYLIGALLVFSATTIPNMLYNFIN